MQGRLIKLFTLNCNAVKRRVLKDSRLQFKVINMLEMANDCIKKDPIAAALYYDELSAVVSTGDLDSRIVVG